MIDPITKEIKFFEMIKKGKAPYWWRSPLCEKHKSVLDNCNGCPVNKKGHFNCNDSHIDLFRWHVCDDHADETYREANDKIKCLWVWCDECVNFIDKHIEFLRRLKDVQ